MSKEQLEQLIQQIEGASDVLTDISNTLPERPSRLKLKGQLAPVINVLQSVGQQLNSESSNTV